MTQDKESRREKQREYQRAYYQRHREALCANQRARHHARKNDPAYHERHRARAKRSYDQHKEHNRAKSRAYWAKNAPKLIEKKRAKKAADPARAKRQQQFYSAQRTARLYSLAQRPKSDICDICGNTDHRIVFDHCHQRGHFRGWLCDRCNRVLGFIKDDIAILMKMAAYLQRNQVSTSPQFTLPGV